MVEGKLKQSTWDTPEGGKRSKVSIRVENFQLLGGKKDGQSNSSYTPQSQEPQEMPEYASDNSYSSDINDDDSIF